MKSRTCASRCPLQLVNERKRVTQEKLAPAHFRSLKTLLHLAKLPAMTTLERTPVNQAKLAQAENAWRETLTDALRRGFYGSITVEVSVQDGTIQHIRRRVEQVEK